MKPGDQGPASKAGTVEISDPVDAGARAAGAADDACPSCDAPGSWQLSSRHRFNPFGGVTLLVLSFWVAVANLILDITWAAPGALAIAGVAMMVWKRTALVCQVCDFVKPRG